MGTNAVHFWDISIWELVLALAGIFLSCLVANIFIKTIKPLRKLLIPSPVLGGFLFLIFLTVYKSLTGTSLINTTTLEIITYHTLGLGFVASALKTNKKEKKSSQKDILNTSFFTVGGYALQAIIGLTITIALFFIMDGSVWPASGVLLPMGYGQGPGQAFTWGNTFSDSSLYTSIWGEFTDGSTFGLSIAAMGFISASIGGVIYLNVERRKGNKKMVEKSEEYIEKLTIEDYEQENEIPTSDSLDKHTVQFGFVFVTYAISFALIYGISYLCDLSGVNLLINTVKPLFWGFNFIFGVMVASIGKLIYNKLRKKGVIKRQYTNNYMIDRISGLMFDIMVVAAFGAINLEAFLNLSLIIPLLSITILGAVGTYFYCKHIAKKVYKDYSDEAFLSVYGMLTGTNATGIILLREIDPKFKTPACDNLVFQSIYSIAIGIPFLLSLGFVGQNWTKLLLCLLLYVVLFVGLYLLMRRDDFFKKKNKQAEASKAKAQE